MAFDTFDTDSVATAGAVFTNGNLTVQGVSGFVSFAAGIAQTVEGKKSGKWYVEFTCVAVAGGGATDGVGIVASWGIAAWMADTNASGPSSDTGMGYFINGRIARKNAVVTSVNATTWGASDVLGIALDLDNKRIWWRKNTGSWIGTTGTPDPASNTNGFDITNFLSNNCRVYPAVNMAGSATKFTANFGASSFTGSVPSGFTSGWTNTNTAAYFGTFACTGKNSNTHNAPPTNTKSVCLYACTVTGTVDSIIVPFAGATITDIKGVIYDDTGTGGLPGALLGVSTNTITSGSYGENTLTFSGVSVTNGSNYWFGVVSDATGTTTVNMMFCPALTNGMKSNSGTYASPTNPFGASPTNANFRYPLIINVSVPVDVSLSGIDATGAAGTFSGTIGVDVPLSGASGTAAAGSFTIAGTTNVDLVGVSGAGAVGSFTAALDQGVTLAGVSATSGVGVFSFLGDTALTGVFGTAAVGDFSPGVGSNFALVGVQATAQVGALPPSQELVTLPLLTIMNDNPIPAEGAMVGDYVPMEEDMPYQIALDAVINTNPIPMTGTMSAVPVPTEGSVP